MLSASHVKMLQSTVGSLYQCMYNVMLLYMDLKIKATFLAGPPSATLH